MIKGSIKNTRAEALASSLSPGRPDDCWHWTGQVMWHGYGRLYGDGQHEYIHVTAYREAYGEPPPGMDIDHRCHTQACRATNRECLHRRCGNPAHLVATTHRANTLRGNSPTAYNAVKERCPKGHAYDEANTNWMYGKRRCRQCHRDAMRVAYVPVVVKRPAPRGRSKTHCPEGHSYADHGRVWPSGRRYCDPCHRVRQAEYRERKRAPREIFASRKGSRTL